jgi:hypothetical protein
MLPAKQLEAAYLSFTDTIVLADFWGNYRAGYITATFV